MPYTIIVQDIRKFKGVLAENDKRKHDFGDHM